jgi:hypothetical protein
MNRLTARGVVALLCTRAPAIPAAQTPPKPAKDFVRLFPGEGDPAYRGLQIQFVDGEVYYHTGNWKGYRPEQLTGSIYDEIPAKQAMKPAGQSGKGHIGFENLGQTVTFRNLAIAVMDNLDSKD